MQLSSISLAVSRYVALTRPRGASLALDFATSQTLDPRITFTRTSNATVTGPDGSIGYAPHNLLTYSEQFDQWTASNVTVTANAVNSPTGTLTADTMDDGTTAAVSHRVLVPVTISFASGVAYTYSLYVKNLDRNFVQLAFGSAAFGATAYANFDVATGVIGTIGASATASITNVGGGWYRCALTCMATSTASDSIFVAAITSTTSVRNEVYAGSNKKLYIWGAQLNVGSLQPYYPTTVKNLLGYTQEFDNAAWTKSDSFVQTNQIRNNTMQGAVAGTPGTLPTNWTVTAAAGVAVAVAGIGTESGINYVDLFVSGTASASGQIFVSPESITSTVAATGQSWAAAWYLSLVSGSITSTGLSSQRVDLTGRDAAGVTLETSQQTYVPVTGSLAAQRPQITRTLANAGSVRVHSAFRVDVASGAAVSFTLRIGMPQLVQGLTAGDVVATYGTARAVMYPAPDGSRTADKLVENTAGASHLALSTISFLSGTSYTYSIYGKEDATSAKRYLTLFLPGTAFSGANYWCSFDLATGAVINGSASIVGSATAMGNGWYRCSVQATANLTGSGGVQIRLQDAGNNINNYTGDGTSGIYIWGAQLSDSASLDPYVYNPGAAPAASAYYGPRFDYDPVTLQPKGLLLEEQRTNSIRNNTMQGAVAGTPGTLPTNWQKLEFAGLSISVVSTGTENGISYVDFKISGLASGTSSSSIQLEQNSAVAASNGQVWTLSSYVKVLSGSTAGLSITGLGWEERSGSFLAAIQGVITPQVGGNLANARAIFTGTNGNASTTFIKPYFSFTPVNGATIDLTIRIGLPQLEQGAFATSVIPTSGTAATRAADVAVMTGSNFSSWYRQDEGTLFAEVDTLETGTVSGGAFVLNFSDGTGNNLHRIFRQVDAQPVMQTLVGGTPQSTFGFGANWTDTNVRRLAYAYAANNFAGVVNAGAVQTDTSGTIPAVNMLDIGVVGTSQQINGHIRRIAYFPRRLSNSELQAITA